MKITMSVAVSLLAMLSAVGTTVEFQNAPQGIWNVSNSDLTNVTHWADGQEPNSANDYRIYGAGWSTRKYCGIGGTGVFHGNSLTIDAQSAYLVMNGNADWTFENVGLKLKGGSLYVKSGTSTLRTPLTVLTADWYGNITAGNDKNTRLTITGAVSGNSWAGLNVRQDSGYTTENLNSVTVFKGDMSAFLGTFAIGSSSAGWACAYFGDTSIGAKAMTVYKTGTIGPCGAGSDGLGEFSAKVLTLAAGATLASGITDTTGGCVRVTQTLTMPTTGKVNLKILSSALPSVTCRRTLLVAPLGTNLRPEQFDLVAQSAGMTSFAKVARTELLVEKDATTERLVLVLHKSYTQKTSDGWNQSSLDLAYSDHWNGVEKNTPLDSEGAYYSEDPSWNGKSIATSSSTASSLVRFGGWSLALASHSQLAVYAPLAIDRLFLYGSTYLMHTAAGMTRTIEGKITTVHSSTDPFVYICGRSGKTFQIKSEIAGDSALAFTTRGGLYSPAEYGNTTFQLDGTNTALSARIRITNERLGRYYSTVSVADSRSLGGAMTNFIYNGIEIMSNCLVRVTASTEFAEPTRGWFVNVRGRIDVPNAADEVKISSPLTMAGTLVKEGAGALALGGVCRFTSAQSTTPLEGTNVLQVAAGRIKPIAKTGYDGLAIRFAAGTGIELPLPAAGLDADVTTYGLYDVAWATPFDLSSCGGVLSVGFRDSSGIGADQTVETAVCTVSSAAAANLRGKIRFVKVAQHRAKFSERDNGDGTVTFLVTVEPSGGLIVIR